MARYKFDQIAHYLNEKRMPTEADRETYIGLEHLDSGNLTVTRWGSDVDIKGQKLVMHKGDILFGRRNTYLKRAAIAPHDGLFSAHGMIWRPKEDVVDASFFPFFVSSDYFMDEAIRISVGSLSPTINWRDLKELEFDLPDIDTQRKLSTLLWAMERAKTAYKNLIAKTDELVKSQFVEMSGDGDYPLIEAGTVMLNMRNGLSPSTKGTYHEKVLTLAAITQGWFDPEQWKDGTFDICPPNEKRISSSEFYICRGNGNRTLVGAGVISTEDRADLIFPDTVIAAQVDERQICIPYLYHAWNQPSVRDQIESAARTTNGTYKINQGIISKVRLVLPPIGAQKAFVTIAEQADKSKFAAQQALADLTATQKALMRHYLG